MIAVMSENKKIVSSSSYDTCTNMKKKGLSSANSNIEGRHVGKNGKKSIEEKRRQRTNNHNSIPKNNFSSGYNLSTNEIKNHEIRIGIEPIEKNLENMSTATSLQQKPSNYSSSSIAVSKNTLTQKNSVSRKVKKFNGRRFRTKEKNSKDFDNPSDNCGETELNPEENRKPETLAGSEEVKQIISSGVETPKGKGRKYGKKKKALNHGESNRSQRFSSRADKHYQKKKDLNLTVCGKKAQLHRSEPQDGGYVNSKDLWNSYEFEHADFPSVVSESPQASSPDNPQSFQQQQRIAPNNDNSETVKVSTNEAGAAILNSLRPQSDCSQANVGNCSKSTKCFSPATNDITIATQTPRIIADSFPIMQHLPYSPPYPNTPYRVFQPQPQCYSDIPCEPNLPPLMYPHYEFSYMDFPGHHPFFVNYYSMCSPPPPPPEFHGNMYIFDPAINYSYVSRPVNNVKNKVYPSDCECTSVETNTSIKALNVDAPSFKPKKTE